MLSIVSVFCFISSSYFLLFTFYLYSFVSGIVMVVLFFFVSLGSGSGLALLQVQKDTVMPKIERTKSRRFKLWALFIAPVITVLILIFALAQGFVDSGLSLWFGERLAGMGDMEPIFITLANISMVSLLTELTSNVTTTEMILPILAGLAVTIKINPLLLMVPATMAASLAFMLPVATPPNAIVFGTDRIKIGEMVKAGILLNIAGIIIATLVMYFWGILVFNIDVSVFPDWAGAAG